MNWFYDMKIGKKLIGAFLVVGAITALVGYVGIRSLGQVADLAASSYEKETLGIVMLKQAQVDVKQAARSEKNFLLASTPEQREKFYGKYTRYQSMDNE